MTAQSLKRLRRQLAGVTLTVALQDYQRKAVLNTFDEWCIKELGRILNAAVKAGKS